MKQSEKTKLTNGRILAAAKMEFGANGYLGASMNNICSNGIPKGLLYHNFESKDSLYLACVKACFDELTERLRAADIRGELRKYLEVRLAFFASDEDAAHIFFDAVLRPPEALRSSITALRAEFDALNREIYGAVLSSVNLRKGVSPDEAMEFFAMQQAMFNGYFSSRAFSGQSFAETLASHEAGLARLLDFMLYGIAEKEGK